ncbi:MAG: hypothetical protein ACTHKK_09060 [Candidatus Nitrosocosmicus sp.]
MFNRSYGCVKSVTNGGGHYVIDSIKTTTGAKESMPPDSVT